MANAFLTQSRQIAAKSIFWLIFTYEIHHTWNYICMSIMLSATPLIGIKPEEKSQNLGMINYPILLQCKRGSASQMKINYTFAVEVQY